MGFIIDLMFLIDCYLQSLFLFPPHAILFNEPRHLWVTSGCCDGFIWLFW